MRRRTFWLVFALSTFALAAGVSAYAAKPRPPIGPPDCRIVLCAYPDCLPSEKAVIPAGQCCPVCVPI